MELKTDTHEEKKQARRHPTVSDVLSDGTVVELVYDRNRGTTAFAVCRHGPWQLKQRIPQGERAELVPYSAANTVIKNQIVRLPSIPEEYGSQEHLLAEIQGYIHRYVDLSPQFERIASVYVLLTWLYDAFYELPYLRLRGDFGSGKTRFLLTVGALTYKPIFASGASTVSPIFHLLNAFQGTLILDEADFRFSDEKAEIVKILNNGNVKGLPVLRTEVLKSGEFNPRAFSVFGPKIVASRGHYDDRALESRFVTEELRSGTLRRDIPIALPSIYEEEALALRNKLLLYRLRNLKRTAPREELVDGALAPRINQVFTPLMSVTNDLSIRDDLRARALLQHQEILTDRSMDVEAEVLECIRREAGSRKSGSIAVKEIAQRYRRQFGKEFDHRISNRWIGTLIRKGLGLRTRKSGGVFVIPLEELGKLQALYERYGIGSAKTVRPGASDVTIEPVDVGDGSDVRNPRQAQLPGITLD